MNIPPSLALLSALTRTPTSKPKKGKAPKRKSLRERNADALADRRSKSIEFNDERRARSAARKESARARDTTRSADRKAKGILPNPLYLPSVPGTLVPGQSAPSLIPNMRRINPGKPRAGDLPVGPLSPPPSPSPAAPLMPTPRGPIRGGADIDNYEGDVMDSAPQSLPPQDDLSDLANAKIDPQALNALTILARFLDMNR